MNIARHVAKRIFCFNPAHFLSNMPSYDVASNIRQSLHSGAKDWPCLGRAVQVDPFKPTLKAPGTKRFKLKYDIMLSVLLSISTCAATP